MKTTFLKIISKIPPAFVLTIISVAVDPVYYFYYCTSAAYSPLIPKRMDFCIIYSIVTIVATWTLLVLISSLIMLVYKLYYVKILKQKPELVRFVRWVITIATAVAIESWQPLHYFM